MRTEDRRASHAGGGNAIIRPFNSFGQHRAEPLAAGVTTGSGGEGYAGLTVAVRAVVDDDLALIDRLLRTGDYLQVRYSATSTGALGSGIFDIGDDVKKYIVAGLQRVCAHGV